MLRNQQGNNPDIEDVAQETGLSVKKVKKVIRATSTNIVYLDAASTVKDTINALAPHHK